MFGLIHFLKFFTNCKCCPAVIVRFCGTSAKSTTGRGLVCSIISHIRFCFGLPYEPIADAKSYEEGTDFIDPYPKPRIVALRLNLTLSPCPNTYTYFVITVTPALKSQTLTLTLILTLILTRH
jgi:hypothetical protein